MLFASKQPLIRDINRKKLDCTPNGRSTDFMAPPIGYGCLAACSYCVTLDTLVHTPEGLKTAAEIQEGDAIISFSLDNGTIEIDTVTAVAQRETHELYVIQAGSKSVTVTGEHPFYTRNRGWVEAKHLSEEDELLCDMSDLSQ